MPQQWIEVNIVPVSSDQPERLLVDLIDELVHVTFADQLATWFYGWYSEPQEFHLRLRIRWRQLERSDDSCDELFARLNAARTDGLLTRCWEGNHGTPGETYRGEAEKYGDLWELSYKDWNISSELALGLVKRDPDTPVSEERQQQWSVRGHLHANRLGWSYGAEALFGLAHARGYLTQLGTGSAELAAFVDSMDQRLEQLINELAAGPSPQE